MNYKGGVGKTTVTANVAAEMANQGKRVLLIDLDPQANLTLSFVSFLEWRNLDQQKRTIKDWYDEFLDHNYNSPLKKLIISPNKINDKLQSKLGAEGRVDLICSHLDLINVDMELSSRLGGLTDREIRGNYLRVMSLLRQNLAELRNEYDFILIDCPPNFNVVTQNAMVASDYFIIPAKADYLSTLGINTLIRHVQRLEDKYNQHVDEEILETISPQLLGIAFTMIALHSGEPISVQRTYIREMKEHPVFESFLRENKSAYGEAPGTGVPVVLKPGHPDLVSEIRSLVAEMEDRILSIGVPSNE